MKVATCGLMASIALVLGACGTSEPAKPQPSTAKVLSKEQVLEMSGRGKAPVTREVASFRKELAIWRGPRVMGDAGALMLTDSRKDGQDRITRIVVTSRIGGYQDAVVRTRCDGSRKGFQLLYVETAANDTAKTVPAASTSAASVLKVVPEEVMRATCADRSKGTVFMGSAAQASAHARRYMGK